MDEKTQFFFKNIPLRCQSMRHWKQPAYDRYMSRE